MVKKSFLGFALSSLVFCGVLSPVSVAATKSGQAPAHVIDLVTKQEDLSSFVGDVAGKNDEEIAIRTVGFGAQKPYGTHQTAAYNLNCG